MSGEAEVAAMAQQISRVVKRDGWTKDRSVVPDIQKLLGKLTTLKVDVDLLQRTKIGAAVSKLKKHDDEIVRGYSTSLTKKWKSQVGLGGGGSGKSSSSQSSERPPQRVPSASPPKSDGDTKRFESARKRLQEGYASHRAQRDSRSVHVLNRPVAKGRRGTTISAAPSRSSLGRAQLAQRRRLAEERAPQRATSAPPPTARRVIPASRLQQQARRASPLTRSSGPMTEEERHRQRQLKYRALSGQEIPEDLVDKHVGSVKSRVSNRFEDPPDSAPSGGRPKARASRPSSASRASRAPSARDLPPPESDSRKAMLDKMFPRVCGVASAPAPRSKSASGGAQKSRATGSAASRRKAAAYSEGQREVVAWLKNLPVDMSEYAPAMFENGFDSIKLLSTIEKSDLPALVPKKGHHRLIQQALDELRHKHSTVASGRPRERQRKAPPSRLRRDDPFDEESDDSFVVSDDDDVYSPGHIAAMFRKNRKRRYSIDSDDSGNMEATFDEIQKEEKRSAIYGEYEDFKEDLRNKNLLKKKKKK